MRGLVARLLKRQLKLPLRSRCLAPRNGGCSCATTTNSIVGCGDFKVITVRDPAVLVIRYDWRNNSVLFVHNLDEKPREVSFAVGLPGEASKLLVNLLTEDHSRANEHGKHTLLLEAYGYRWYRVGGLDYLLKRSDIDTDEGPVILSERAH